MKKSTGRTLYVEFVIALFIFLFVYTGINKLYTIQEFRAVLSKSPLLSFTASYLSLILPVFELLVSLLLLLPHTRTLGLFLSTMLMALFTAYIGYMILFTPKLPCSCGGILKDLNWSQHLLLNFALLLMSIPAWLLSKKDKRFIAINRNSRIPV
ncbi:methylamine utilization protein MauE [Lacibacter cauensis]|uniref:Methylamine utilization protein MauE n=1 Tax=Lacibacter cauensis TaxID=510947 RepID=A0A562S936_9BACT|nr:MauE/DoxX family redox-associated membrane protein [Lacibacter cauensis]TWI77931.1 methylamine utilization protein MauE [Lacibacter cauensis]